MIFFRVDTKCGLGHLMRMRWLALALIEKGQRCHFFIESTGLKIDFFRQFQAGIHYVPALLSEQKDAQWCCKKIHELLDKSELASSINWVIVDGYCFGLDWETQIKQAGYSLLAIDDLERGHVAALIVDPKWQGIFTTDRYLSNSNANKTQKRLLGPEFALLAPEYSSRTLVVRKKQVMFSLGGGGNWIKLTDVIEQLILEPYLAEWSFLIILGPYAVNTDKLVEMSRHYSQIKIVIAPPSLHPFYVTSQFFVGALGTSLYELAATKTPALTFAMALNQKNKLEHLADLGHYLHLDELDNIPTSTITKLITVCLENLPRINLLCQSAKVVVDGLGAKRIAAYLLNPNQEVKSIPSALQSEIAHGAIELTPSLFLRPVADKDINAYLTARNMATNSWRMTINQNIPRHEHYCWWFKQQRQSYVLEQDGQALLYVWQQLRSFNDRKYWIGGWFAASDLVNFSHAQLILDWQLKLTQQQHPDAVWLAVIHRENKFVQLLNKRAGFIELKDDTEAYEAARYFFPKAESSLFQFVGKWSAME